MASQSILLRLNTVGIASGRDSLISLCAAAAAEIERLNEQLSGDTAQRSDESLADTAPAWAKSS